MKLLLTIWISAVLTQEVFSSTLVRYRRHAVSKPTSSVHTEYEATYEQKGKHGNGSYSTVSGKQEVVHDNCNDNWNAFADKCATLIKDLVASLGNAVSSKPGDATNLQLRIRNTFKHFDSTDNCTCFAKNSLTSLFDNITATTVQPAASGGGASNPGSNNGQVISPAQTRSITCEGESCNEDSDARQKAPTADPKLAQQRARQPNLSQTSAKNVDPELADTSKEASTTNSRRGVQYPETSGNAGVALGDSKQPLPTSPSPTETKKILFPSPVTPRPAPAPAKVAGSPVEVIPLPQSQSSAATRPLKSEAPSQPSAPQQDSFRAASPVDRPAKSNDIVKSGISVKPVPALSSASKISSPEPTAVEAPSALNEPDDVGGAAGPSRAADVESEVTAVKPGDSGVPVNREGSPTTTNAASNQAIAPVVAAEPVNSVVAEPEITSVKNEGDKGDFEEEKESERTSVASPVTAEPVGDAVAEPQNGSSKGSSEPTETPTTAPVVSVPEPVAEPEITSGGSEEDEDDDEKEKGSESDQIPVAGVSTAAAEPSNNGEGSPAVIDAASNQTPVVPTESVNSAASDMSEEDKDDDEKEKGSESDQTPVATPATETEEPVNEAVAQPEITPAESEKDKEKDKDSESGQVPPPVIATAEPVGEAVAAPQIASTAAEGDGDAGKGSESNQGAVVEPVTSSLQDQSPAVSDGSTNSAPNPKSSLVPPMPVSNSPGSEMPVVTQAAGSTISDDRAPPETASPSGDVNVIPALTVKQPPSQPVDQENPSAEVPKINTNSNLPDSTGPVDSAGTVNPSPIYQSLPTAPSATPSSDSAVINDKPQRPATKQEVVPGVPLTTESDNPAESGAARTTSAVKQIPAAPAPVSGDSQDPAKAAKPLTAAKGGEKETEKVFIVTPVPVYPEEKEAAVVKSGDQTTDPLVQGSKSADPPERYEKTGVQNLKPSEEAAASGPQVASSDAVLAGEESETSQPQIAPKFVTAAPVYPASAKPISGMSRAGSPPGTAVDTPQMGDDRQETPLTTPIPVLLVDAKDQNGGAAGGSAPGRPSVQQHPLFSTLGSKKSGADQPKESTGEPAEVVQTAEDGDLTKPTTFQTTSTDPTPPQKINQSPPPEDSVSLTRPPSASQDSDETAPGPPATSPKTPRDDDDEEEDCCSCESCTEEEVTNPKQYKEMACKDLEEARKELKAIFDKIKKRLKCGKKAPQKIVAS